ncbi:MAG: sigma-70 family RNA polymerase sigma factor [Myxococcota bacterium]|jgi:RNA polymerase sigma-70 factor (ECF subfamily)|nr:sigma-70 family RNA polymerase sigma factor [Myxococcota bacterium]
MDVEEIYRRYGPMVLRRCRRLLHDEEAAVDALHDVFVQVLRHEQLLDLAQPSSLLYRIATNVCLNRLRARRRRPEHPDDELLLRIASLEEPEERLIARRVLQRLFGTQRESTRTLAVLHLLDGLTLEEVAAQSGLSVSGVRKRLRRLHEDLARLQPPD